MRTRILGNAVRPAAAALLLALGGLAALAAPPARAAAAESPPDVAKWAHDLPHEVMSPFCPGRALAECPSSQADELRRWIIEQARAGATKEEVEAALYQNFGPAIRQVPRAEGVGLLAYAVPAAFIAGGAALLGFFLLRRGGGRPAAQPEAAAFGTDPELEELLDREIDEEGDG